MIFHRWCRHSGLVKSRLYCQMKGTWSSSGTRTQLATVTTPPEHGRGHQSYTTDLQVFVKHKPKDVLRGLARSSWVILG